MVSAAFNLFVSSSVIKMFLFSWAIFISIGFELASISYQGMAGLKKITNTSCVFLLVLNTLMIFLFITRINLKPKKQIGQKLREQEISDSIVGDCWR